MKLFLTFLFAISPFFLGNEVLLLTFLMVLCIVQATSVFMIDEKCHWDSYANVLPIEKSLIIKSKYLFCFPFVLSITVFLLFPILFIIYCLVNPFLSSTLFPTLCIFFSSVI